MKRVFIVHGWGSNPKRSWFPWLKRELEKEGYEVHTPQLPSPFWPDRQAWVDALDKAVGTPDDDTYFIGHSLGCTTILLFLQEKKVNVGGAVFVAPWVEVENPSWLQRLLLRTWREVRIAFRMLKRAPFDFSTIFSDDDPFIALSGADVCRKKLGANVVVEHGKHHFDTINHVTELKTVMKQLRWVEQHKQMHYLR
ncbi:serine hydrolase family protein [Candidatus Woesearchaeota archaeon]|nr:serine hydrolase family protein [Candidatus Woesearchaeota archaeon]